MKLIEPQFCSGYHDEHQLYPSGYHCREINAAWKVAILNGRVRPSSWSS